MPRTFKVVPLSDLGPPIADAVVMADSDLDALRQAKQVLGPETAFDIYDGDRLVLTHLPPRRVTLLRKNQKQQ